MNTIHHSRRPCAHEIAFCVTLYHLVNGSYVPEIPDQCPYREEGPCHVVLDHLRERRTGPQHPLYVCRCLRHLIGYTLYPPGYGPYGQAPLVAMTPDGKPTTVSQEASATDAKSGSESELTRFLPTYLGASVDAAEGRFWPSAAATAGGGGEGDVDLRYSTQIRRILRALIGLGVAPDLDQTDRLRISQHLGIQLVGKEAECRMDDPSANQVRASTVCRILTKVGEGWKAVKELTHAFYLACIWGLPSFWDEQARVLRTEPFRRSGMGGAAVA